MFENKVAVVDFLFILLINTSPWSMLETCKCVGDVSGFWLFVLTLPDSEMLVCVVDVI